MANKVFENYLSDITSKVMEQKNRSLELLKNYIRIYGEMDWTDDPCKIETTFYGDGYYTAEIRRVMLDDNDGSLIIDTDLGYVCEHDGDYTTDTILDILCSVVGRNSQ